MKQKSSILVVPVIAVAIFVKFPTLFFSFPLRKLGKLHHVRLRVQGFNITGTHTTEHKQAHQPPFKAQTRPNALPKSSTTSSALKTSFAGSFVEQKNYALVEQKN
jgi:hypothetical protein